MLDFQVDAVITWVNSKDPVWVEKYEQTTGRRFKQSKRFTLGDPEAELSNCLRCIRQNMPWLRKVFVVTMDQVPNCLQDEILVTHAQLGLGPVFNSHAIETSLHHIPDLLEHFLYFNDDFFVVRKVYPSDFFHGPQLPRVRCPGRSFWRSFGSAIGFPTSAIGRAMRYTSKVVGVPNHGTLHHVPYALTKSLLSEAAQKLSVHWESTSKCAIRYKCRKEIVPIYAALMIHLKKGHKTESTKDDSIQLLYCNSRCRERIGSRHVVCLNSFYGTASELQEILENTEAQPPLSYIHVVVIIAVGIVIGLVTLLYMKSTFLM